MRHPVDFSFFSFVVVIRSFAWREHAAKRKYTRKPTKTNKHTKNKTKTTTAQQLQPNDTNDGGRRTADVFRFGMVFILHLALHFFLKQKNHHVDGYAGGVRRASLTAVASSLPSLCGDCSRRQDEQKRWKNKETKTYEITGKEETKRWGKKENTSRTHGKRVIVSWRVCVCHV